MINTLRIVLISLSLALLLSACGRGTTTTAPPTKVVVKLATSGTLPATLPEGSKIGAIDTTLTYATDKGLSITGSDVVISGNAFGIIMLPNVAIDGKVKIGGMTGSGFDVGEFATLTFKIAPGSSPLASDFNIDVTPGNITAIYASDSAITDISGQISVKVQSVTFQ